MHSSDHVPGRSTLVGVAYGIAAGALWGTVFLAPELVREFGPLHLAVGRYIAYGLISALLIAPRWTEITAKITPRDLVALAFLALAGNTLYYILLTTAVQTGGIAMTSLVIGFLPVTVTIIGSRDREAVPLTKLAPSLLLCAAGAICIAWDALARRGLTSGLGQVMGLLCAIGALISWTSYAVGNSRWLARRESVSSHDWNLLIGLATGVQALARVPVAFLLDIGPHPIAAWAQLAGISIGVAVLASIIGNGLWNRMSRLLPLTLIGQMILFETLFALIYGFLWERRLPTALEITAFALVALSVLLCIAAHRRPAASLAASQ
jgi:drug/metabolite transporter (DMT)-like permease